MSDNTRPFHWGRPNPNYTGPEKATSSDASVATASAAVGDFSEPSTPPWEWEPVEIEKFSTEYVDECKATVSYSRYADGVTPALIITDSGTGESLVTASVALDQPPREGHVFIKDWSENSGVLEELQSAGVVGEVTREIPSGFVQVKEVPLIQQG